MKIYKINKRSLSKKCAWYERQLLMHNITCWNSFDYQLKFLQRVLIIILFKSTNNQNNVLFKIRDIYKMILNSIFSQFKIIGTAAVLPVLLSLAERTGGYRTFLGLLVFYYLLLCYLLAFRN